MPYVLQAPWGGAVVKSDVPITEDDLQSMTREFADAYTEVEKWDLLVTEVLLSIHQEHRCPVLTALPAEEYRAYEIPPESPDLDRVPGESFSPVPVLCSKHPCEVCHECGAFYWHRSLHPDNGCNYGAVDNVLKS